MSASFVTERAGGPPHGWHGSGPLELAGLRRRYGRTVALDGLSFTVEPRRIFGFLGPNGAGKTTAMRIVMGIEEPDEGTVRLGGRLVTHADRLAFGYMPEQRGLYPKMRVRDHLAYLARLHGLTTGHTAGACDRWLRRLGIGVSAYERVEALSHGNQQRVQLAAALVHDPRVLVLDEPFSGLDPLGIKDMATFMAAPAPVRNLIPVSPGSQASRATVVLGTIIMYLTLVTYGGWVTSGVLEEKSSRVIEVILSAVRHAAPWELPASAAVTLAATYGLVRLAGRAYSGTILRFSSRVTLREALRP